MFLLAMLLNATNFCFAFVDICTAVFQQIFVLNRLILVFVVADLTGLAFTITLLGGLSILNFYLAFTNQTYFELTKRERVWYLNIVGMPEQCNPFDNGLLSNVGEFLSLNPWVSKRRAQMYIEPFDEDKYHRKQKSNWLNHRWIRNEYYECC